MHIDMTGGMPIRCSKCGSTNALRPVNDRDVAIRCGDCGHQKLTQEGERRKFELEHPEYKRDTNFSVSSKPYDATF